MSVSCVGMPPNEQSFVYVKSIPEMAWLQLNQASPFHQIGIKIRGSRSIELQTARLLPILHDILLVSITQLSYFTRRMSPSIKSDEIQLARQITNRGKGIPNLLYKTHLRISQFNLVYYWMLGTKHRSPSQNGMLSLAC